ncbi:MAG: sugar phosphate isomerase/epimerase [Planctomycetales bacterium]|nr:sugar phosphate isomerase/epimerase [Planctomycetales bacterium]
MQSRQSTPYLKYANNYLQKELSKLNTSDQPNRRTFSRTVVAAGAGLGLSALAGTAQAADKLFEISLAEWSLHKALFAGKMKHIDFAEHTKKEYGITAVELVNQFFKDKAEDKAYIADLKKRSADNGVTNVLIMCDGEGNLGDANLAKRAKAVENHFKWVTAAKELGCHSIRVNAASSGSYDDQIHRAADGLRALTEFAAEHEINVIVENHGGLSSNGAWLAAVIEKVSHDRCGTLPDFGNFRVSNDEMYNRYKGVMELMPYAKAVSAKSHDFNDKGDEIHTDYLRMMKIVLAAGYRGFVGIEYEGSKLSEGDGILATKRLLERVREQLSA